MVDGTRMDFRFFFFFLSELWISQSKFEMFKVLFRYSITNARAYLNHLYHKDGSVSHDKANCFTWTWWWGMLLMFIFPLLVKQYTF